SARSIAERGTPPGRNRAGLSRQATIVDSTPTGVAPPSTIKSMRPLKSAWTCSALVGETWPERLAEGATTGPPHLGFVGARDGPPIRRGSAEPIDRLGRERDQAAGGKHARRFSGRRGVGPQNACR